MKKSKLILGGVAVLSMILLGGWVDGYEDSSVSANDAAIRQFKQNSKALALCVAWRCGRDGMSWEVFTNTVGRDCMTLIEAGCTPNKGSSVSGPAAGTE